MRRQHLWSGGGDRLGGGGEGMEKRIFRRNRADKRVIDMIERLHRRPPTIANLLAGVVEASPAERAISICSASDAGSF